MENMTNEETNVLEAICTIVEHKNFQIREFYSGKNRANSMGDALENYIKDAFANTFEVNNESKRLQIFNEKFSWLGSQNNPPDIIIKNGDAIEVKKIQNANNNLALNSSYPKAILKHDSPMLTNECKQCENWTTKDLIYCIGHTSNKTLNSLWMVYGNIYAAKHETYQKIKDTISSGIETIPDVVFSKTKELGRVNKVDPLGITSLRIRGMWQIENPKKVFSYLYDKKEKNFELVCIIPVTKYNSFPIESKRKIEENEKLSITDRQVKDPNNPARLIDCKLIQFSI